MELHSEVCLAVLQHLQLQQVQAPAEKQPETLTVCNSSTDATSRGAGTHIQQHANGVPPTDGVLVRAHVALEHLRLALQQ
jgi:hypothetical protein